MFVTYVHFIATCLAGHAGLANPTLSAEELAAHADELAMANAKARGRGPGVVADRNDKRKNLEGDLDHLLDYVKLVIQTQALDPAAATTLILSAGLSIRKITTTSKARSPPSTAASRARCFSWPSPWPAPRCTIGNSASISTIG